MTSNSPGLNQTGAVIVLVSFSLHVSQMNILATSNILCPTYPAR